MAQNFCASSAYGTIEKVVYCRLYSVGQVSVSMEIPSEGVDVEVTFEGETRVLRVTPMLLYVAQALQPIPANVQSLLPTGRPIKRQDVHAA